MITDDDHFVHSFYFDNNFTFWIIVELNEKKNRFENWFEIRKKTYAIGYFFAQENENLFWPYNFQIAIENCLAYHLKYVFVYVCVFPDIMIGIRNIFFFQEGKKAIKMSLCFQLIYMWNGWFRLSSITDLNTPIFIFWS